MNTLKQVKEAIIALGIETLFAVSSFTWLKPHRLGEFYLNTGKAEKVTFKEGGKAPNGVDSETMAILDPLNKGEFMKSANKRIRQVAGRIGDKATGNASVNRKGKASVTGIDVSKLEKSKANQVLFDLVELRKELFAQEKKKFSRNLSLLFIEGKENGKDFIFLHPEFIPFANEIIVDLEKTDDAKSLRSFAWYPVNGSPSEKQIAIAKAIRSHHKRMMREEENQRRISEQQGTTLTREEKASKEAERNAEKENRVTLFLAKSQAELRKIAKAKKIEIPKGVRKATLAAMVASAA